MKHDIDHIEFSGCCFVFCVVRHGTAEMNIVQPASGILKLDSDIGPVSRTFRRPGVSSVWRALCKAFTPSVTH
jgi:hypothetical protein